jgi:hypothetical protein
VVATEGPPGWLRVQGAAHVSALLANATAAGGGVGGSEVPSDCFLQLRDPSNPSEGWACVEAALANPATPPFEGPGRGVAAPVAFGAEDGAGAAGGSGGAALISTAGRFQETAENGQAQGKVSGTPGFQSLPAQPLFAHVSLEECRLRDRPFKAGGSGDATAADRAFGQPTSPAAAFGVRQESPAGAPPPSPFDGGFAFGAPAALAASPAAAAPVAIGGEPTAIMAEIRSIVQQHNPAMLANMDAFFQKCEARPPPPPPPTPIPLVLALHSLL